MLMTCSHNEITVVNFLVSAKHTHDQKAVFNSALDFVLVMLSFLNVDRWLHTFSVNELKLQGP